MSFTPRSLPLPQVLPPDLLELAPPSAEGLCAALSAALARVHQVDRAQQHTRVRQWREAGWWWWGLLRGVERVLRSSAHTSGCEPHSLPACPQVSHMYSWSRVTERTVRVYDAVAAQPHEANAGHALLQRLARVMAAGPLAGSAMCVVAVLLHVWWVLLCWLQPEGEVEMAVDWPLQGVQGGGG